jgi:polyhydroxybutyrate depolymerase
MISPKAFLFSSIALLAACGGAEPSGIPSDPPARNESSSPPPSTSDSSSTPSPSGPSSDPTPGAPSSNGCSSSGGLGAGDSDLTITSGGRKRNARVHVPKTYDPTKPTAVVLNFHGRLSTPSDQNLVSKATSKADSAGFVVVHPEGVGKTWNGGLCCGEAQSENVDDVGFTRDLLDELAKKLCVDPKRVFAMGLSNGAFMSNRLACELADRIAAIGPVAGQLMMTSCSPKRPVPVMYFHGNDDDWVSYDGMYGVPGAQDSAKAWAKRNGCSTTPKETYAKGDATCLTYSGCKASADVTLCTIAGGGHTWPGGAPTYLGKTSQDIDATSELWTFFMAHPMP